MPKAQAELSLEEELMILMFWAQAVDIQRKFTPEQIQAVAGLEEAIVAVSYLPSAIGWEDEPREGLKRRSRIPLLGPGKRP